MEFASLLAHVPNPYISFLILGIVLTCTFHLRHVHNRRGLPLPPGPRKYPFVGNFFQIPKTFEWETYAKWCRDYNSDIIHLDVVGKSIVVVNTHKIATELFEKRSAIYSSRAETVMLHELTNWGDLFGLMPYGEAWKERRRLFSRHFHPTNAKVHQVRQLEYTHRVVRRLLDSPEKIMEQLRFLAGATTIALAYGLEISQTDDPYLQNAEKAITGLAAAAMPGGYLVDSVPVLKYLPSWMPGAGFKRDAKVWKTWATEMMDEPFEAAQKAIAEGTAKPSFVSLCFADIDGKANIDHQRRVIRDTAANFFVGGADTTVSAMKTFVLVMTSYPDIQQKAQEELDRVVAPGHFPSFEDDLPYITAIMKEIIRWQTIVPLAIPHLVTEDDEFNGYFIPKGSIVAGNAWAITHDERDYPEPFMFNPDRFIKDGRLDPNVRDPYATFGFGRRACIGKHIALSALWIAVASILTVYDISPEIDHDGRPILPKQEYISSMILHPIPFKCCIKPRSEKARKLILSLDI